VSDLLEKLQKPTRGAPGTAKATLKQLLARWGEVHHLQRDELVEVVGMGGPERWRRVTGRGLEAIYELEGA
jgi:hypothetical protein